MMDTTNYEDYYLSNFFGKSKAQDEVEVEVIAEENADAAKIQHFVEYERATPTLTPPQTIQEIGIARVKTELIRHKNTAGERCEPQTFNMAIAGLSKNKNIKAYSATPRNTANIETKTCAKSNKTKRKRSKGRKAAIVSLCIIFALLSCFLIADIMSNGYFLNSLVSKVFKGDVTAYYYAVEVATFNDETSARITSEEIRASGGSGYVVHDELYRVIAEVYKSEKDAENIATNLNLAGYVTNIYLFKIGEIDYSLLPMAVRNSTKNVLKYQDIMYQTLYQTAISLEKQQIDYTSAREDIGMLKSQINNMLIDYESAVNKSINDKYVVKVRNQISSMVGALDNLIAEGSKNDRLLSDIRYINTMILNTHRALINSIQS